jgi:hypothetical protein
MRLAAIVFAAAVCASAGCAGPGSSVAPARQPAGGITLYAYDGYIQRIAVFDARKVAVGPEDGPAYTSLDLTPAGTWKGTVASFADGEKMYANYVELEVTASRITGPGVDVSYSLVEGGGYRLVGMWMKANVDLTVTPASYRDQFSNVPALAPGVYGGKSVEAPWIRMTGEAASLDAPRWPQVALAALSAGLGVRTYRR